MDLPSEIWEKIIVEIKDVKECIKLFKSFPKITQKYIRNIFENHIQALKVKILYCYQNCLFLAIENKNIMIMKYSDIFNDIKYVKYMSGGCIVAADKKGKINFWDFNTRKYLDCIEIDRTIFNETSVLGNIAPPLNPNLNYILECLPQSIGLFLDTDVRRTLAQTVSRFITKNYQIASTIVDISETTFNLFN